MNVESLIEKLDSKMIRMGSSLLGKVTSDYDYAVSESMWNKVYPILGKTLQFRTLSNNGSGCGYKNTNCEYPMFNIDNMKLAGHGFIFDFIIYKDDDIEKVRLAITKFTKLFKQSPVLLESMINTKQIRIELFQHFLKHEFNIEDEPVLNELDSLFDNL